MEKVEYKGVSFDVIRTLRCIREHITDDAKNYLYTHWDFIIEANWQPAFVSYTTQGNPPSPQATPGQLPGVTDLAILQTLLQPRGLLKVTAGGSVILETPTTLPNGIRYPCDVTGGPVCKIVGVPKMIGTRHWVVTLHFTADVRPLVTQRGETLPFDGQCVLSNLWVGNEDIDFQRRTTRYFQGQAILRADVMRAAFNTAGGINANLFRDFYLFPCPRHYQRQNVKAKLNEDGTILDWSFEDAMRGYDLGASSPIVSIECFRTAQIKASSPFRPVNDFVQGTVQSAISNWWNLGIGTLMSTPSRAYSALHDNLPTAWRNIRCDLIGDRNADLGQLTRIALGVCMNDIGLGLSALATGTNEFVFRQDVGDQVYTSAEMSVKWSDDAMFAAQTLTALNLIPGGLGPDLSDIINNFPQAVLQIVGHGSLATVLQYCTDQRHLKSSAQTIRMTNPQTGLRSNIPLGDGLQFDNVAADRASRYYDHNPNFNNALPGGSGGHGVAPYDLQAFNPLNGTVNVQKIEQLIVQILQGEADVVPANPATLNRLSSYPGGGL